MSKPWAGFSSAKFEKSLLFHGRRRPSGDSQIAFTSDILEDYEKGEDEGY
jgi:hypothetical protein